MNIIDGIPVCGEALPKAIAQMKEAMKYEAVYGALMADDRTFDPHKEKYAIV